MNITIMSTGSTQQNFERSIDPALFNLLQKTWAYHQVPKFYQHLFMRYLAKASVVQGQKCVREEIRALEEQVTYIQSFLKVIPYREGLQEAIRATLAKMLEPSKTLPEVYKGLAKLRSHNFKCAFLLQRVRIKYEKGVAIGKSSEGYFYSRFAMKLDNFRKDITRGKMSVYLQCSQDYDPFYLHIQCKSSVTRHAFDEHFQISPEEKYKYQKMEGTLLEWLALTSRKRVKTMPQSQVFEQSAENQKGVNSLKASVRKETDSKYFYTKDLNPRKFIQRTESQSAESQGDARQTLNQEYFIQLAKSRNRNTGTGVNYLEQREPKVQLPHLKKQAKRSASQAQPLISPVGKISKNMNRVSLYSQPRFSEKKESKQKISFHVHSRKNSEEWNAPLSRAYSRRRSETIDPYHRIGEMDRQSGYSYGSDMLRSRPYINLNTQNQFNISLKPIEVIHFEPAKAALRSNNLFSESKEAIIPAELKDKSTVLPSEVHHRSLSNTFENLFKGTNAEHTKEELPIRNSYRRQNSNSPPPKQSIRVHSIPEENEDAFKASAPRVESNSSSRPLDRQQSLLLSNNSFTSLPSEKKQIKLAHGKFTLKEFADYLRAYPFHEDFRGAYNIEQIIKWAETQQTYVTEFKIKDEPGAIGVASLVPPSNNVLIKMWATSSVVYRHESITIFKKYIDYIEKSTQTLTIFFKGKGIDQVKVAGFTPKKEGLLSKIRQVAPKPKPSEFQPFLECKCSQVSFPSIKHKQILDYSQSQKFTSFNSLSAPFIFLIDPKTMPQVLNEVTRIDMGVKSMDDVNEIAENEGFDQLETKQDYPIQNINFLRFGFQSQIKEVFGIGKNCFKITGNCLKREGSRKLLCWTELSKQKGRIYFGRGYETVEDFCKEASSLPVLEKVSFVVPMFQKSLYGRYEKARVQGIDCHGQWQISFAWEEELKGAVKMNMSQGINFKGEPFMVMVQLHGIPLYVFQVKTDDIL